MADQSTAWPVPKFSFEVKWDSEVMSFQEVSGLDAEKQSIDYRSGNSAVSSVQKVPGMLKYTDITMKKGVFKGDISLWKWFTMEGGKETVRKPLTISLKNEAGDVAMVWKVVNAWPSKVQGTDLKAQGNEVAVETIVLAHEGLTTADK